MTKVFLLSDLHINYEANWTWLSRLSEHEKDILIVAGDISQDFEQIKRCLVMLCGMFKHVFYTPGNHDVWVKPSEEMDSLTKLDKILEMCKEIGVKTNPEEIDGLWIVPLFSWFDSTLGEHEKLAHKDIETMKGWSDYLFCKWPQGFDPSELHDRNDEFVKSFDDMTESTVISFSHMLPRRELLPPRPFLKYKFLPHVMGSTRLEEQIRQLGSTIHCFGHSHINQELLLDGVRYVQNAMGYPKERETLDTSPVLKQVWPVF
ncbi:putative ser/thr phosphatase family protein [Monocercomonoides exilis]|uniref:putative ser/thr phosphatase family protein n=1 Tax=Monocercomonoides exilis TaxID=2049356 RepID=UPI00355A77C7|nr:putative ser/thr phosphatase family protein [Monocercomonoides exilis]|eukprot:MONOS_2188.1-p1 / transcript=MONOS_2188.1 / gene=MONOS_2188 / organism=Monocercomonoides_exilis_PA203 / gene_product=serine / transcript_product=serine / location=Mono_scaffold00043:114729-115695(-) / protein_length=260 / sequence_SO=supercontig / SO=protein_coding / is_pseudo=false